MTLTTLALAIAVPGLLLPVFLQSAEPPVKTVETVDLERYLGTWYEVARFPNRFQNACAGNVRAEYARRPDGRIDVVNSCRTTEGETTVARGVARVADPKTSARLKVRFAPAWLSFLPFVWGDYWILGLGDDYRWAVVGSPDRDYLWILSRTATLGAEPLEAAKAVARQNGFDLGKLQSTDNTLSE